MLATYNLPSIGIHHRIGQAAPLGALSPIGTSATHRSTQVALPAITDAKGTMHKHLQCHICLIGNPAYLVERQLTCQDNLRKPCRLEETHLLRRAVVGLRTGVQRYGRQIETGYPHILNNQCIGAGLIYLPYQLFCLRELLLPKNGVQGNIDACAIEVRIFAE